MQLTGISVFYFVCVAFGFLFALITVIFGELGAHLGDHGVEVGHPGAGDVGGHELEAGHAGEVSHAEAGDAGGGHGMPQASVLNTLTILVFVAFFGLAGLFATWVLKWDALPSLGFALPVGLMSAAAEFVLYVKIFIKAQGSSEATMQEILGCEAEVITGIPADRVGEIAYVIKGTRYNAPATSEEKEDLPRGTRVRVVNTRGGVMVVKSI